MGPPLRERYNFAMRVAIASGLLVLLCGQFFGQEKANSITVPAAIDHNRVIINVDLPLPNGSRETVRAWVDNGDPDLSLSRRLASLLNLPVTCAERECSSPPPKEIVVGGFPIPLTQLKNAKVPLRPVSAAAVLASGMAAEINIPGSVLKNYDVLVDYPDHRFSIGAPGTIHFRGSSQKTRVGENGLIQVPSQIDNKKYNLALDMGSTISLLSDDLFEKLAAAHPDWPRMTGGVGPANMWGAQEETGWNVMRLDRMQFGPLFLTDVPVVQLSKPAAQFVEKRAGMPTVGSLGSDMLVNYRVGLDYAHSTVYFDIGRMSRFPEFDVVGLVLRPEIDGRFTIIGVADFEGKPSVAGLQAGDELLAVNDIPVPGSTMGQVWALLRGNPGQERKLTIGRAGKTLTVPAKVQHFLAALPEDDTKKHR